MGVTKTLKCNECHMGWIQKSYMGSLKRENKSLKIFRFKQTPEMLLEQSIVLSNRATFHIRGSLAHESRPTEVRWGPRCQVSGVFLTVHAMFMQFAELTVRLTPINFRIKQAGRVRNNMMGCTLLGGGQCFRHFMSKQTRSYESWWAGSQSN